MIDTNVKADVEEKIADPETSPILGNLYTEKDDSSTK